MRLRAHDAGREPTHRGCTQSPERPEPGRPPVPRSANWSGPEGLSLGELRDRLDLPAATSTAQLNILRNAALLHDQREGRVIRVRANHVPGFVVVQAASVAVAIGAMRLLLPADRPGTAA